jgi:cyclase
MNRYFHAIVFLAMAALPSAASAQTAPAQAPPPPDFSKVEIKTTKIGPSFYTLEGQGGTIGALVGADGVFLVDSQFAPLTDKLVAALKPISDGRVRMLVNTHYHPDHTGGNENFAKLGAIILSRDELRDRLAKGAPAAGNAPARAPAAPGALPMVTYEGTVTVHMNGEDVKLIPIPAAHTDGDTMVWFPRQDVLMMGDFFRTIGYPNIDRAGGGTLNGMIAGLQKAIDQTTPATKVVPGHGAITDRAGLMAHRDMIIAIRDRIAPLVQQGKTLEEVMAAKPTSAFDDKVPNAGMTTERFEGQVYAELKK